MINYFKRLNILLLIVGLAASAMLSIACVKPQTKDGIQDPYGGTESEAQVGFYIREITGSGAVSVSTAGLKIPQSKIYNFKACFSDKHTQNMIKGHGFIIHEQDLQREVNTDENGCIDWSEPISYNFLADSKYVILERKFEATGLYSGSRTVRLAINPWASSHDSAVKEVVDLRHHTIAPDQLADGEDVVKRALFGLNSSDQVSSRYLWIENINSVHTQTEVSAAGTLLNMDLAFSPKILVRNLNGQTKEIPLNDGEFVITPYIVAVTSENGSEIRTLLSQKDRPSRARGTIKNGRVRVSLKNLLYYESTFGQIEVALHIEPINGPTHLKAFEGVFLLGDFKRLSGGGSGEIRPYTYGAGSTFTLASYIDRSRVLSATLTEDQIPANFIRASAFEFKNLDVRFLRIAPGETSTSRTVEFRVETCVKNPLNGMRVLGEKFIVYRHESRTSLPVETNSEGCINWTDQRKHSYYQPEQLQEQIVTIRHRSGFKKDLTMILNPWDFGWTFGFDSRAVEPSYIEAVNQLQKPASQFFLPGFNYYALQFRYEIDEYLTLKIKKKLQFYMNPRVLRYNSITRGRNATEPLRDGVYLIKFALQKDYFERNEKDQEGREKTAEYISVVKKLVRVQDNRIITNVEFSMRDLRLMRIRSQLLVEIATIDESKLDPAYMVKLRRPEGVEDLDSIVNDKDSGLKPRTFLAPLVLINNAFGASFRPTEDLEETQCENSDCNELISDEIRAKYEIAQKSGVFGDPDNPHGQSKYFQDVRHLENTTVSDLIPRWRALEEKYKKQMEVSAGFANFTESMNLEYAQVFNDSAIEEKFTREEIERINPVLGIDPAQELKNKLNEPIHVSDHRGGDVALKKLTDEDLIRLIREQKMDFVGVHRFCHFFINYLIEGVKSDVHSMYQGGEEEKAQQFLNACVSQGQKDVQSGEQSYPSSVFLIDQKLKIYKTSTFLPKGGMALNFQTGTSFGFGRSKSLSDSWNIGFGGDLGDVLGFIKKVPLFGSILSGIKGGFSRSWGTSSDVKAGANVSSGTYLASQQKHINLVFSDYEYCSVIKFNADFLKESGFLNIINPRLVDDVKVLINIFSRGLMLCTGQRETEPLEQRETYYYFTQHFTEGDMLDTADLVNHPWLLAIRGVQDYLRFLSLIDYTHAYFDEDKKAWVKLTPQEARDRGIDLGSMPLETLKSAYERVTPTFPGFYTITSESDKVDQMY